MWRRRFILALCAVTIAGVAYLLFAPSREPSYQGRRLSEIVRSLGDPIVFSLTILDHDIDHNNNAIKHIGTNAIPYLLKWIQSDPPPWKLSCYQRLAKVLQRFKCHWNPLENEVQLARGAEHAFYILRAQAEGAIPELSRMMNETNHPVIAERAARIMAYVGEKALPMLIAALKSGSPGTRRAIASTIGNMGDPARPAVPLLIRCLADPDEVVAFSAASSLGQLGLESDIVVPALVSAVLTDKRKSVRENAFLSLVSFGDRYIPSHWFRSNEQDWLAHAWATNALRRFAPENIAREKGRN